MPERGGLRRLASESAVYSSAGLITRVLTFLLVPIFTRVLDPADYGVVALVNATLACVAIFAILGLDSSAGRWFWDTTDETERRTTVSTWFSAYLVSASIFAVGLFAMSQWLGSRSGAADGAQIYRLAACTLPLGVVGVVVNNLLRMQRRPWATAAFASVSGLGWLGFSVLFVVVLDHGVPGVYEAQVSAAAASTAVGLVIARGWLNPAWFRLERLRAMLRYALPLIPAALAFWVVNLSDRYFLRVFADTTAVGLYQVSNAIAASVGLLLVGFQQAWGPFTFSLHREPGAQGVYARAFSMYAVASCLVAAAVSVAAPEIIRLVATPRYGGAADAVPWLALSYVALGMTYVAALGANLTRTTRPVAAAVGWAALSNTALNLALVPSFGGVGAGAATLGGWLVMAGYLFVRSHRLYPIPYRFASVSSLFVATGVISVLGEAWRPDSIVLALLGKTGLVLLLVPLSMAVGLVTPRDISSLRGSG